MIGYYYLSNIPLTLVRDIANLLLITHKKSVPAVENLTDILYSDLSDTLTVVFVKKNLLTKMSLKHQESFQCMYYCE